MFDATRIYYLGLSALATAMAAYIGYSFREYGNLAYWMTVFVMTYTLQPIGFALRDLIRASRKRRAARQWQGG